MAKPNKQKETQDAKTVEGSNAGPPVKLVIAVKEELRAASPKPPADIKDNLDLRIDLRLTDDIIRGLAAPFQRIAREHKPTATVSRDECDELDTVGNAVALVSNKAGFEE
jgi:hypothetical protein